MNDSLLLTPVAARPWRRDGFHVKWSLALHRHSCWNDVTCAHGGVPDRRYRLVSAGALRLRPKPPRNILLI